MKKIYETIKRGHNPWQDREPVKIYKLYEVYAGEYHLETKDYEEAIQFYDAHPMLTKKECLYGVVFDD